MKIPIWIGAAVMTLTAAAPVRAELPPLIPRDVLFGNPDKAGPQISPDGKHLAYLAPDDKNVLQVWVRTDRQGGRRRRSPATRSAASASTTGPHDGKHLLYLQDVGGDENFHLFAIRPRDGQDPRPDARSRASASRASTSTRSTRTRSSSA